MLDLAVLVCQILLLSGVSAGVNLVSALAGSWEEEDGENAGTLQRRDPMALCMRRSVKRCFLRETCHNAQHRDFYLNVTISVVANSKVVNESSFPND